MDQKSTLSDAAEFLPGEEGSGSPGPIQQPLPADCPTEQEDASHADNERIDEAATSEAPEADDDEEMRQEELDEEAETDSDTEMGDYDTGDEIEGDDRVPPGIWELHGDQLVRIDQCGTDIELIMEIFPGLWSLDGDRLVPTDAEDFLTRYFMHLIESDADFLSELRPFPLPDLENMGSIEQLLENLDLDQHALVRDFFIDLWDNFRGLIAHRHNFRFPDVERDLDSLSDDHPVVQILDAANTEWRQELLNEIWEAVKEDRQNAINSLRARLIAHLMSIPSDDPPPARLLSDGPDGRPARCCICMTEYSSESQVVILTCHPTHHFHRSCLVPWIRDHLNCPLCRAEVQFEEGS
ncbi:hypothetical protein MJO28_016340 [Puccinia striiformis f. sp. tritici]|uniref:Uncharacterized protein n=1 Tax=Puccinia striiformis f. sp. tritici TaxID=168172 RepID=A0ACC0DPJ1_9BASI|nr:hypothetical protein Pst134EA_030533 [Puccinia striiformis f. sp. tritici]KAH9446622.1 hypothetical protein Pst134EA_030533 [Puccinia striiformis f. sp. tritici]KAI7935469.1 hypothetical protein MJO28_016340 [Puccinia striiformis f. sp. tritici]